MMYEHTAPHEGRGYRDAGLGPSVACPSSRALRGVIRLQRKRAAERPTLEAFKRARLEAHKRMQDKRGDLPTIEEFNLYAVADVDYERGVERFETLPELRPSAEYERLPKVRTATSLSGRSIVPGGRHSFYTVRRGWWRRLRAWVTRGDDHD